MKLGVFTVLFGDRTFEEALDLIANAGLQTVEIGCGPYPGKAHCDPDQLLVDERAREAFMHAITSRGLSISALSVHGNPLHPNAEIAKEHHRQFEQAVRLAETLGVDTVVTFSGCPGESEHSQNPSWVTCPWPEEFAKVLEWQWNEKVIPYWKKQHEFLEAHNVRVAIEAHPGFVVYHTESMLRLRNACGPRIGVNFDPSHLFWQGMDPVAAIKTLGKADAIFHVHAKDTSFDRENMSQNGVLDTKSYRNELERSWIFRTVGYGHGEETWRNIISALQLVGYTGAVSIEHEDSLMALEEGFLKAATFLNGLLIRDRLESIWWT
ncbi:sugar phosphate isomerase/epimerase family protein [Ferroacidibacillus organovorans]|uniref:Xylose isomerase n=1 Tax=Ferroacidibacillus organovorans TaxID=1765683 RepID=A0A124IWC1_9BACL|nr:sugar phosphate isomerase/epimerase [Ferroacidibacillus organovorans]KUO96934.1 xylose isomerase [Ferroacidibacillus organovorans]